MKSLQIELLSRKRQRRDHFFGWWPQFSIVLFSCKGPFKAWFELAVRTTLLRVRLLTKTVTKRECDVLLVTIWKYTYRNLETAETKCSGVSRGGPPLSQPPPPPLSEGLVPPLKCTCVRTSDPVWKETPCASDLAIKRPPSVMTKKSLDYRLWEVWLLLVFDRTEMEHALSQKLSNVSQVRLSVSGGGAWGGGGRGIIRCQY